MTRRGGEITSAEIDRKYPHQVAIEEFRDDHEGRLATWEAVEDFCLGLSRAERGHIVTWNNRWWKVHCFSDPDHAARFRERFDGVPFNPKDRGCGSKWMMWNRKT